MLHVVVGEVDALLRRHVLAAVVAVVAVPEPADLAGVARLAAQLVTLLVDQQLALDALEPLPAEAPDPVGAVGAEGAPVEPLGLEDVPVDLVQLPPPPRAPPVE